MATRASCPARRRVRPIRFGRIKGLTRTRHRRSRPAKDWAPARLFRALSAPCSFPLRIASMHSRATADCLRGNEPEITSQFKGELQRRAGGVSIPLWPTQAAELFPRFRHPPKRPAYGHLVQPSHTLLTKAQTELLVASAVMAGRQAPRVRAAICAGGVKQGGNWQALASCWKSSGLARKFAFFG